MYVRIVCHLPPSRGVLGRPGATCSKPITKQFAIYIYIYVSICVCIYIYIYIYILIHVLCYSSIKLCVYIYIYRTSYGWRWACEPREISKFPILNSVKTSRPPCFHPPFCARLEELGQLGNPFLRSTGLIGNQPSRETHL